MTRRSRERAVDLAWGAALVILAFADVILVLYVLPLFGR